MNHTEHNTTYHQNAWNVVLLGLASGLPFGLVTTSLQAWWAAEKNQVVMASAIGLLNLIYLIKPLWAHWYDHAQQRVKLVGYLNLWIISTALLAIGLGVALYTHVYPLVLLMAILLTVASANQDLVQDGLRVLCTPKTRIASVNSWFLSGYRMALIFSCGVTLLIADHFDWTTAYIAMASLMLLGCLCTPRQFEPPPETETAKPDHNFIHTLKTFWQNQTARQFAIFVLLYRLVGEVMQVIWMPFVFDQLNFSLSQVAIGIKGFSLVLQMLAVLLGGLLIKRWGGRRCLWAFSSMQVLAIIWVAWRCFWHTPNLWSLYIAMGLEQSTAALTGLIIMTLWMQFISHQQATAHFALLTSICALDRAFGSGMVTLMLWHASWQLCFITLITLSLIPLLYLALAAYFPHTSNWLTRISQ